MRLFIAINFNVETKSRLLALREDLQNNVQCGRFSLPENLHLTLAFLGECTQDQISAAKNTMTTVSFEPLTLTIDHIGYFKRDSRSIYWAGVNPCRPLLDLQCNLFESLRSFGFMLENRKYSPHITLAREVVGKYPCGNIEPFGEMINAINLMKSERINGKLTYTSILKQEAGR